MALKILSEENNKLIGRKEVRARINYAGATPNREALKKEFKDKNVVIRRIKPEFGETSAIVEAVIYTSKEVMDKLEAEHVKKRNEEKPKEESEEGSETPENKEETPEKKEGDGE